VTPAEFVPRVLAPGAAFLEALTGTHTNEAAQQFLMTVALQESGLVHRFQQIGNGVPGPARGFWQFEQNAIHARPAKGREWGLLIHGTSAPRLRVVCDALSIEPTGSAIWRAIEGNDLLAFACARLLLLTDMDPVPLDRQAAWLLYANVLWRPGKPHPDKWPNNWAAAKAALGG